MKPRIQPEASSHSFPQKLIKWIIGGIFCVALTASLTLYFWPQYRFYYVPEELPPYNIPPIHKDDTLRIAFIGGQTRAAFPQGIFYKKHDCHTMCKNDKVTFLGTS